jgi:hypothetical protein
MPSVSCALSGVIKDIDPRRRVDRWPLVIGIPLVIICLSLTAASGVPQRSRADRPNAAASVSAPSSELKRPAHNRPAPEEQRALRSVSDNLRRATVLFGFPVVVDGIQRIGGQNTGFVISKARRLVATAAHVADWLALSKDHIYGILDGTSHPYRVERAWYHPGLVRVLDMGLKVRSTDPTDGNPFSGIDVAVVQLSADGPELKMEMEFADEAELARLNGRAVGSLVYPIATNDRWPRGIHGSCASFVCSRIVRPSLPPGEHKLWAWIDDPQLLFYNEEFGPGASGAPLFLPNGHVVGIAPFGAAGRLSDGSPQGCGFRADCLRELVSYHGLDPAKWKRAPAYESRKDWGPDPNLERFRKAARLLGDFHEALERLDFRAAVQKCTDALSLAPNYGGALYGRAKILTFYFQDRWDVLNPTRRLALAGAAVRDASRSFEICPEWNPAHLDYYHAFIYLARAKSDPTMYAAAIVGLDAMLERGWPYTPLTDYERAYRFSLRAQACQLLGKLKDAEDDYARSIRADPGTRFWYQRRAQFWEQIGRFDLAEKDWQKGEQVAAGKDKSPVKIPAPPNSRLPELPSANRDIFDSDKFPADVRSAPK